MRNILLIVKIISFSLTLFLYFEFVNAQQKIPSKTVKIFAIMSRNYPEYNEALEGFKEALTDANIKFDINLVTSLKEDNPNLKIIDDIKKAEPDLILALGTNAVNSVNTNINDIPIVFSMVLNPTFGNSKNSSTNNKNITGVSLSVPVIKQFSTFKEIIPNLKTVGVIYSPDENSELIKEAEISAKKLNIDLIAADVNDENDVPRTLNNLIRIVDVIWMIVDKAVNSIESRRHIIMEGFRNDIPVIGPSENYVVAGAAFAISADYKNVGWQTGKITVKILEGNEPSQLPCEYPNKTVIYINEKIINSIGIKIPNTILQNAVIK